MASKSETTNIKNLTELLNNKEHVLAGTKQQLAALKDEITYQRNQMLDQIRRASRLQAQLDQAEGNKLTEEDAGKIWAGLNRLPAVKKIAIDSDGTIKFSTSLLRFRCPKKKSVHLAGTFDVTIKPNGEVRFVNTTYLRTGYERNMHHPHVFGNGSPCLGSIGTQLPELITQRDYISAVVLVLEYLRSVNPDDPAGAVGYWWPICPDWANKNVKNAKKAMQILEDRSKSGESWKDTKAKQAWEKGMADAKKKATAKPKPKAKPKSEDEVLAEMEG